MRNEIKKGKKIYFYDNGIRNALISNFAPIEMRQDAGALWENFMISERIKRNAYCNDYSQLFFWRTKQQQEIDLIEEKDGQLFAYEFKLNPRKKTKLPLSFENNYSNVEFKVISKDNFWEFL
jgi:predicted AAA+ superfamily ATPase